MAIINGKSYKYPKLNDRNWLNQKYIVEKLSTGEIAKLLGIKVSNSVRQALIRHEITVRNVSDGLTCRRKSDGFELNQHSLEVIQGCLLGDGMLKVWNKESDNSFPSFRKKNKNYDHVKYVAEELSVDIGRIKPESRLCNGRQCSSFAFSTLSYRELLPLLRKWYPKHKIVPKDLELTPTVLLHWFLDDGSTSWRNRKYPKGWKQRKKQVVTSFSSESFTKQENQTLCRQMRDNFGIKASVTPVSFGTGWRIRVAQSNTQQFFEVLGHSPVASLEYKWKIP